MRANLMNTLTNEFTAESKDAISRLKDNVAPYTRYVHSEQDKINRNLTVIEQLRQKLSALRAQIEMITRGTT